MSNGLHNANKKLQYKQKNSFKYLARVTPLLDIFPVRSSERSDSISRGRRTSIAEGCGPSHPATWTLAP